MAFEGSKNYIANKDLKISVKAAMHLEKPLLIKGEPGTGKHFGRRNGYRA